MTDSIRERIVANLVLTLQSITVDNGYDFSIAGVSRIPTSVFKINEYPYAVVVDLVEDMDVDSPATKVSNHLIPQILVAGSAENTETEDVSKEANRIIANVYKAIRADYTRGGLAMNTRMTRNETIPPEEADPNFFVIMDLEILYRFRDSNPYQI